jgi:hypothetical protein
VICQAKRDFVNSGKYYQRALQLGFNNVAVLRRLLKVSFKLDRQQKEDIITYIHGRLAAWEKEAKKGSKILPELHKIKAKMERSSYAG